MSDPSPNPGLRGAFTLIEVILATSILAIVGVTVSSVLMVAARSSPPATGGSATDVAIADALAILALDIGLASSFLATETGYTSFVGADANGDGAADEIGYAFLDDSGGQLLRLVGDDLTTMHTGISSAEFSYLTGTVTVGGASQNVVRGVAIEVVTSDGSAYRRTVRCVGQPAVP